MLEHMVETVEEHRVDAALGTFDHPASEAKLSTKRSIDSRLPLLARHH